MSLGSTDAGPNTIALLKMPRGEMGCWSERKERHIHLGDGHSEKDFMNIQGVGHFAIKERQGVHGRPPTNR